MKNIVWNSKKAWNCLHLTPSPSTLEFYVSETYVLLCVCVINFVIFGTMLPCIYILKWKQYSDYSQNRRKKNWDHIKFYYCLYFQILLQYVCSRTTANYIFHALEGLHLKWWLKFCLCLCTFEKQRKKQKFDAFDEEKLTARLKLIGNFLITVKFVCSSYFFFSFSLFFSPYILQQVLIFMCVK